MPRARGTSGNSIHLEIPRRSTETEDSGAHELSSEDEFQDATDGRKKGSRPVTPSSPIPITRVERVDDEPRHGEVPGTSAYDIRRQDAVPDEIEVIPEGALSKRSSRQFLETPLSPGGTPIPRTVVEKLDPDHTSYGDEPGTPAYKQRMADAAPDLVLKNADPSRSPSRYSSEGHHHRTTSTASIPATVVTRANDELAHGEVPGTEAAEIRKRDATPDKVEIERDVSDDTLDKDDEDDDNDNNKNDDDNDDDDDDDDENNDEGFGDDFDDFEEGAQAGVDDDFGDFDDFEQGAQDDSGLATPQPSHSELPISTTSFPLLDFDALSDLPDLLDTTELHLDAMFPSTIDPTQATISSDDIPVDSPIFPTERSRSLWKQLITPPPLQPPNWTQSRIRRLFLISLGVPVDLDEILPPSKQKKLILPDISVSSRNSTTIEDPESAKPENDNISKLRSSKTNESTTSIESTHSASAPGPTSKGRGRERPKSTKPGPPPPPTLDLNAVKRLCATTDEKIAGFTDEELQAHVKELEGLIEQTSQVLEYWLKRRDGLRKEKEAFEGVIENLVRHAKRCQDD